MKNLNLQFLLFSTLLGFSSQLILNVNASAQDLTPPRVSYGLGLGRLLTTESERKKIDDLRFHIITPPKVEAEEDKGPTTLHIDGLSLRPDQPIGKRVTIWINARAYPEDDLPYGLSLVRSANGEITGLKSVVSKGAVVFAKIGEDIPRPQTVAEAKAVEKTTTDAAAAAIAKNASQAGP